MSTASTAAATPERRAFVLQRLGSMLALAPLGVWTVNHIWDNLAAFQGAEAWEEAVTSQVHPVAHLFTLLIVLGPLLVHTAWGIGRLRSAKPNNTRYGFFANLKFLLQRLSALGLLGFLGAHLWLAMIHPRVVEGHAEPFVDIAREMHHHGPTLLVYLLGTLATAYHLGNGLGTAAMSWGLIGTRHGLAKVERLSILFFLVFLGMSWGAVYALWSAGGALAP
jgi:succinate dehydrogenase / fumarate reductase cytochrome b subunit